MARVDQNVFMKVGLLLASVALFMSSFGAAQDFEGFDDGAPVSIEVDYLDVDDASPPISSKEGDEYAFPPNLSPESYEKLNECATKIRKHNAEEILAGILQSEPLTTDSCEVLVHLGYDRHIRLVKTLLSRPELKEKASEALPMSVQIWETCASVVEADLI